MASVEESSVVEEQSILAKDQKNSGDVETKPEEGEVQELKQNGDAKTESETKKENEELAVPKVSVPLTPELANKIARQVEYYFGNFNLPRDKFLKEEIKKDDGWVEIAVMLKFKRLASLSTDSDNIFEALKSSELIEINQSEKKLRRLPSKPMPDSENIKEESICRTIYLKGFKKDGSVNLEILLEFFRQYGTYESIIMRRFNNKQTHEKGFKGSILIVYPDVDSAKKLMEVDEIMFHNAPLLRKWYAEYQEEKKKEIEERVALKEARAARQTDKGDKTAPVDPDPKPTGTYLHLSGLKNTTSREDITAALARESVNDVAFIGLKRGDQECYLRLDTPFSNMEAVKKLFGKVEVLEAEATVRAVTGDEEVTQLKLAREARLNLYANSNKRKRNFGGGRGGGGRGGRGGFKRRRN